MKKIIHTLDISENKMLHALALAWTTASDHADSSIDKTMEQYPKPSDMPSEIHAMLKANISLAENLGAQFWDAVDEQLPDFPNNKKACNPAKGIINVFDEIYENSESVEIAKLMANAGVETSDDHVERLANDLRKKRGGKA